MLSRYNVKDVLRNYLSSIPYNWGFIYFKSTKNLLSQSRQNLKRFKYFHRISSKYLVRKNRNSFRKSFQVHCNIFLLISTVFGMWWYFRKKLSFLYYELLIRFIVRLTFIFIRNSTVVLYDIIFFWCLTPLFYNYIGV